ncbi:aminoglycoside adenylyltransferase domain-containing protein [Dictyobacter kobayashii]|uniref:Streptomycin 3''-adenylyltransferase n=1 Tax=Dictyobacter kobayashii TaxID=2014872 RepID=A0A402AYB9_9CHLR|nr:aminoglycoside adenylyltransferase domain-containing protein [Dictyobacter kobayashii]GCE24088.1 streptomycin 3''-adenylyltransferase [Dictyobacter kobayashii]
MDYNWTNCSKVIKAEVQTILAEFERLLGDNLLGIYLYGSLAAGGFNPERSDINLLVVTARPLAVETRRNIIELVLRISRFPAPLDITFIVKQELQALAQSLPIELHYDETVRQHYQSALHSEDQQQWSDQAQSNNQLILDLSSLHHYGVCLYGQPIAETIPVIPDTIFRTALIQYLQEIQARPLQDPITFVLDASRGMAYLRDGSFLSKRDGGTWGLNQLPEQYHPLLQQVLAIYQGERLGRPVGRASLESFATLLKDEYSR